MSQVACGEAHTVALDEAGTVYSWGWNAYGQLGLRNTANRKIPKKVAVDALVSAVSAGWAHSMAVTTNQRILSWGWGKFGQLGRCEAVNDSVPKLIPKIEGALLMHVASINTDGLLAGVSDVLLIACGREFSVALVKATLKVCC